MFHTVKFSRPFILFVTFTLSSCKGNTNTNQKNKNIVNVTTVIDTIYLINTNKEPVNLYYNSVPEGMHSLITIKDTFKIFTNKPIYILNPDNGTQTMYITYPKEYIFLGKKDESSNIIMYVKDDSIRNNELNLFRLSDDSYDHSFGRLIRIFFSTTSNLNFNAKDKIAEDYLSYMKKFIIEYKLKKKISTRFETDLNSYLENNIYAFELAAIIEAKTKLSKIKEAFFDSIYSNSSQENNDEYIRAKYPYIKYKALKAFKQWNLKNINLDSLYDFVDKNFSGNPKEYFLLNIVKQRISESTNSAESLLTNRFMKTCQNTEYKDYVSELIESRKLMNTNNNDIVLITSTKEKVKYDSTLQLYKGNLIYIDIWASWCGPCLAEMPYSIKLKDFYNGKPLKFMYISLDNEFKLWNDAAVEEEVINNPLSFLLPTSLNPIFSKKYNITSIPHYILIGKDGKVINGNAPRPSDKALQELIDKNL